MKEITITQLKQFLKDNNVTIYYYNTLERFTIAELDVDCSIDEIIVEGKTVKSVIDKYKKIQRCPHCDRIINED